jgi:alkanesulfonate monooxygenase SsuD/methylene tetrahydromethanopterin reductase-like flavin-dependent oxidoreductase (luciferase family)
MSSSLPSATPLEPDGQTRAGDRIEVGLVLREEDLIEWQGRLGELTAAVAQSGIDHLTVGDHVSFAQGHGVDGLIKATALLAAHPTLPVQTGVYLIALRHPATVARALATIAIIAPGRFTFGIGVGGDDPRELELCGVDPRTRGARTTEAVALVRRLLTGERTTFAGRFFDVRDAAVRPAPAIPIPVLVGGRSDGALRRTALLGDGWLALWVSPERYVGGIDAISAAAQQAGRSVPGWRHTLQLWAAFGATRERAVARIGPVLRHSYGIAFERFARYTPCGPPGEVADALAPYLAAGCRRFNIVPVAEDLTAAIAAVAELKRRLQAAVPAVRLGSPAIDAQMEVQPADFC